MKHNFREWYVRFISVLLSAVLLCGTTGCSLNEGTSSNVENFEPVPVPDGGWTAERLSKTIRINGMALPEPITVENMGEEYTVGEANTLKYKGSEIAVIIFDDNSIGSNDRERKIKGFALNSEVQMDNKIFFVNGITLGSTAADAIKAFGEPSEKNTDEVWIYYEAGKDADNNYMVLWFDADENISWISVRF